MDQRLCQCGCGEPTPLAAKTDRSRGTIKGEPITWIKGHDKRKYPRGSTCLVDGCDRTPESRGMCHSHFEWSRRRDGAIPTHVYLETPLERFEAKVKRLPSGHWIWTAATASDNLYGAFVFEGRAQPAHRVAWQLYVGPIPDGLVINHLCRKTLCVNPEHLEVTTYQMNTLHGDAPSAANAAKTHCLNGHPFEGDNLIIRPDGGRACRACRRERSRKAQAAYRARQKAARDT